MYTSHDEPKTGNSGYMNSNDPNCVSVDYYVSKTASRLHATTLHKSTYIHENDSHPYAHYSTPVILTNTM